MLVLLGGEKESMVFFIKRISIRSKTLLYIDAGLKYSFVQQKFITCEISLFFLTGVITCFN